MGQIPRVPGVRVPDTQSPHTPPGVITDPHWTSLLCSVELLFIYWPVSSVIIITYWSVNSVIIICKKWLCTEIHEESRYPSYRFRITFLSVSLIIYSIFTTFINQCNASHWPHIPQWAIWISSITLPSSQWCRETLPAVQVGQELWLSLARSPRSRPHTQAGRPCPRQAPEPAGQQPFYRAQSRADAGQQGAGIEDSWSWTRGRGLTGGVRRAGRAWGGRGGQL